MPRAAARRRPRRLRAATIVTVVPLLAPLVLALLTASAPTAEAAPKKYHFGASWR